MSCQIHINSSTNQQIKLLVNIDDESGSSFQSINDVGSGNSIVLVNSIFRITGQTVVNIHLKTHSELSLLKGGTVRFRLLSGTGFVEAFSLRMTPLIWRYKLNRVKEVSFPVWSSEETRGSFVNTDFVVTPNGYFVAGSDSIYIVVANIILFSEEDRFCTHSVVFKSNDNKVAAIHNDTTQKIETVTMHMLRYLKFTKNDRVWLELVSTCDKVRVRYQSTFAVCQLHESTKGLSATSTSQNLSQQSIGGFVLKLNTFQSVLLGDYTNYNQVFSLSSFIQTKMSGVVLFSIDFRIIVPEEDLQENVLLAVTRNQILNNTYNITDKTDVFWTQSGTKGTAKEMSLQLSAEFNVEKDDQLRVQIFLPRQGKWMFAQNSQVLSVVYLPVMDKLELPMGSAFRLIETWKVLKLCEFTSDYIVHVSDGSIRIRENGVYFISIDFQMDNVVVVSDIELALKVSVGSKQTVFAYTAERGVGYTKMFRITSSLRLHTTHILGVYARSSKLHTINASCARFQIHFVGNHYSVIGFQANLKGDFVINGNTGYFSIANFQNNENKTDLKTLNYNTGDGFDYDRGVFKAPFQGVYMLSVNVVVKKVTMTASLNYVALTVKINKKDSAFSKLKQHIVGQEGDSRSRNSTVSFCAVGAVELQKLDEVTLEVYVNNDERWSVDARSSFSLFLVSQRTNGLLVYTPNVQMDEDVISGFETSKLSPPYGMFVGTSDDSPRMQEAKKFRIMKSGVYAVSVNFLLNRQGVDKVVTLKLTMDNTTTSSGRQQQEIQCDTLTTSFQVLPISCTIVKRFKRGESFTIQITSLNGDINAQDFADRQSSGQNVGYVSVVPFEKPVNFQAGLVHLKVRLSFIITF